MAYTLNTSHPLYANLIELFGVQGGALVSHKTARTFTKHADATYGTGTWGEHFSSLNGGYTAKGASFTPALALNTSTTPTYTVIAVFNALGTSSGTLSTTLQRAAGGAGIRSAGKDSSGNLTGYRCTGAAVGTGNKMLTMVRIGETAAKLYNDKTLDFNGTGLSSDYNDPATISDYLLGWEGQSAMACSLVWLAVVSGEVTSTQISDLYDSLGADNAFGLVSGGTSNGTASGTPDTLDLIAPTASASGTGGANGSATGSPSSASITSPAATATGTTAGSGTITTPALKNNTGTILASISGWTVNVYNASTGALVVQKTGLTTSAGGVLTVSDAAITAGTTYAYEPVHATYGRRLPTGEAS